jgi:hypothetical protein
MEKRYFIIAIALILLAGAVSKATATGTTTQQRAVNCAFSATFADGIETNIDTNNDKISASLAQGLENCNIGRFFFQGESEYRAPVPATPACPAGSTLEVRLQQGHTVATAENGDQLFVEYATDALTLCLKESDGTFSFSGHGNHANGTGQFAGASGPFEVQGTGRYLAFGFKEGVFGGFGQFTGTVTGTLILPKGGD